MNIIAFKEIPIDSIEFSGQFQFHLQDPATDRKAANIRRIGIIHEPVIRVLLDGRKICLAGERRCAACKKAGLPVRCKLVTCSDEEAKAITLSENAEREHNPQRQREELAELTDALAKNFAREPLQGRQTPKGQARKMAAQLRGVTPGAVRQAEHRERMKKEVEAEKAQRVKERPIQTLGMAAPPAVMENAGRAVDTVEDMIALTLKSRGLLEKLLAQPEGIHQARAKAMKAKLEEVSAYLRGMRPTSLCPACKALPKVIEQCVTCETTGWVSRDQEGQIPAKLWDVTNPVVRMGKALVPVTLPKEEEDDDWSIT